MHTCKIRNLNNIVGVEGVEPSHNGSKDRRLSSWLYSIKLILKACFQSYRGRCSMARILGFKLRDGGSIPSAPVPFLNNYMSALGLEPRTNSLKGWHSTIELCALSKTILSEGIEPSLTP